MAPTRALNVLAIIIGWTICSGIGAAEAASVTEITGLAGREASLPCTADVAMCGDFHSIKWYRGSQRVFVYSDLANLERSEGSLANRAQFVMSPNESKTELRLSDINLDDEGLYRCEITYLEINERCPVIHNVNLTILAAPEYVEIYLEDPGTSTAIRNVSKIGPLVEGETVTLLCRSKGGRPVPRLQWWNGSSTFQGESMTVRERETGVKRLQVTLTRYDIFSEWRCVADSPALTTPLIANVKVDVYAKPANVSISGLDTQLTEGIAAVVYCQAEGALPAASITWFNGSNQWQKSAVETTQVHADGTYVTRSRLIFTPSRFDHRRSISCQANNEATLKYPESPVKISQHLRVEYKPNVYVSPENITVNESMDVLIFCTHDSNPIGLTSVTWYKDGEEIDIKSEKYEGGTSEQPALLVKKATRTDTGEYACTLSNAIGSGDSENVAYVSIQYPAEVRLTMEPSTPVNEMERPNVTLNCQVMDGNPSLLVGVRWYLDGELLKELPDCPLNDSLIYSMYDEDLCDVDPSKLLLEYVGRSFQGNYSCEGLNAAGWGPLSNGEELIIYYPPGNTSLSYEPEMAVKDSALLLNCGVSDLGQPAATQYRWTRNGHVIPEITESYWNVTQVTLNYRANYTCTPVNEAGEGEPAEIEVDVFAAPNFIERLAATSGALAIAADNARLSCRVECYPACQIDWYRNGVPLRDSPMYKIDDFMIPENPQINVHFSVKSVLSFNLRMWSQAKLDPIADTANYTCSSSANSVGEGVSSTTFFRVEYAPEHVIIDRPLIEVEEGSTGGFIECSAAAYPEANYFWQFKRQIVGNGPRLVLDYGLSRDKTGEYACVAYNKHGNATAKAVINVVFKPECSVTLREADGKTKLICEVKANPEQVDFLWVSRNSTLTKDAVQMGLQSVLTIDDPAQTTGTFSCYANNSAGFSTPCEINVERGLYASFGDENIIIVAIIAAAIVVIIVVCLLMIIMCRRKLAEDKCRGTISSSARESPEGGSSANLPPGGGNMSRQMHKWPLRPGVQVHVNNSVTLANSGSVLKSKKWSAGKVHEAPGNPVTTLPHYETLRSTAKRPPDADEPKYAIPEVDSGSESTRSVVRISGSSIASHHQLPAVPTRKPVQDNVNNQVQVTDGATDNNRAQPKGVDDPKAFYENLPFHGLQTAPNKEIGVVGRACIAKISQIPKSGQHASTLAVAEAPGQETGKDDTRRSLRVSRELPALDFRSLTLPRKVHSAHDGCDSSSNDNQLPPVPAPRYFTLKRNPYQNIPLPKKSLAGTQQFLEMNRLNEKSMKRDGPDSMNGDDSQRLAACKDRILKQHTWTAERKSPFPESLVAYADVSLVRVTPISVAESQDPSPGSLMLIMGAGQEVQV